MKTKDFKLLQNGRELQICQRKNENKQTEQKENSQGTEGAPKSED